MVYGWVSERFPRYNTFYEMKGTGPAPGGPPWDPGSMSLNAPHHKEKYIWFMGGDLNGFQDIMHFMKWRGRGSPPWDPLGSQRDMSLNVPYHKEQEYIWFREGILNPKSVIMHFHFFSYKCLCDQIWPWSKIGQGHPRVTIYAIYDGPTTQMLHTKFRANRPAAPEKKIFEGFLPYMGKAGILVMWPGPHTQTTFPHPMEAPHEIWLQSAQWFQRKRRLKMWTHDTQTDRQTTTLPYDNLTNETSAGVS